MLQARRLQMQTWACVSSVALRQSASCGLVFEVSYSVLQGWRGRGNAATLACSWSILESRRSCCRQEPNRQPQLQAGNPCPRAEMQQLDRDVADQHPESIGLFPMDASRLC